jgi:hypothetical protein
LTAASIDHLVSLIIFVSAIMLFIGMFSQIIRTGIDYQQHKAIAAKCSDLLDNMLLSPGIPPNWGQLSSSPEGFGLQAVEFTQYRLSPFSLMRLRSNTGTPVTYSMTNQTYSNITMGFGQSLLVPYNEALDYSTASKLLGVNGTYGFSLTLTPIVNVAISLKQSNPLILSVSASGTGFPLANAEVDYSLVTVDTHGGGAYPDYIISTGATTTDTAGSASVSLGINHNSTSYAFLASVHLSGLTGIGYFEHVTYPTDYIVPFIGSTEDKTALLAHSYDVTSQGNASAAIHYSATFLVLSEDYTFNEMPITNETGGTTGLLNSGQDPDHAYDTITIGTSNPGILVVAYSKSAQETGIVVMPWGLSSLAFPMTFGGDPKNTSWVATDLRQVMVNRIAYQAKLSVWSLVGHQVNG